MFVMINSLIEILENTDNTEIREIREIIEITEIREITEIKERELLEIIEINVSTKNSRLLCQKSQILRRSTNTLKFFKIKYIV